MFTTIARSLLLERVRFPFDRDRVEKIGFQLCALYGDSGVSRSKSLWCLGSDQVANVCARAISASPMDRMCEPSTPGAISRQLMLMLVLISIKKLGYREPASTAWWVP